MNPTPRFLPYGSPDALFFEPLTSPPGNGFVATGAGVGGIDYNEEGVLLGLTASLDKTDFTAKQMADLQVAGCMTIWVEAGFLYSDYINTTNEYPMSASIPGSVFGAYRGTINFRNSMVSTNVYGTTLNVRPEGKSRKVRIDISWIGNFAICYYDYFFSNFIIPEFPEDLFTKFSVGSSNASGSVATFRLSQVQLSTIPVSLTGHPSLLSVASFGHSFMLGGDYPYEGGKILGNGGNGVDGGEVLTLPTIQRDLAKLGLGFGGNRINDYSAGGALVSGLAAQVTTAITKNNIITCAIIQIGINNVISNSVDSSNETDLQIQIDRLKEVGCRLVILCNCTSVSMDDTLTPGLTFETRVDTYNGYIDNIVLANLGVVTKIDTFNLLGGHSNWNPINFKTPGSDFHLSTPGYHSIGKLISKSIIANLG